MEMPFQWSRFLCRSLKPLKSGHVTREARSRTTCYSMAQTQDGGDGGFTLHESNTFISRATSVNARLSVDGALSSVDSQRFHPYGRQLSDGSPSLQHCSPPLTCLQDVYRQDPSCRTHNSNMEDWEHFNMYSTVVDSPIVFPVNERSKYPNASVPLQQSSSNSLFPKPVYSYSILIFMALKNSKTGSLPVSEIYSFMTEHFPYFKTAPDGWKNSVRHNLSLNKCFEKVENKNSTSSRKGCLWSLNPAKVEKMQEELHKWLRKDPVTVRRSMARPEDLDHLFGERRNKIRSLPPYSSRDLLSKLSSSYSRSSLSCKQPEPQCPPSPHYVTSPPPPQQLSWFPPNNTTNHPYSLCTVTGKIPPQYSQCSATSWPTEGDAAYDVDTLNPSLVDLQLQGSLWEELREDSLVSDSPALPGPDHGSLVSTAVSQGSGQFTCGGAMADPYLTDSLTGYLSRCTTSITLL